MCGIAVKIDLTGGRGQIRMPVYEKMQQTLERRGPDQKGMYLSDCAALIHPRLSVIDIERGKPADDASLR
jgi:asparagine synthase (glutamine-hydrolysing)